MFKQAAHTHRHKFEGTHFHPVLASCQRLQWYLPASCVTQPYLINCRLRHSHKTLQYVREREKERVCVSVSVLVCVPQEAWGMNSLHRNAQLSLGVFTSKHTYCMFFDKASLPSPNFVIGCAFH